ncbi:MAG: DUF2798 domain-containing protein [Spirochaetaceae bacterium]|nr:DUF2798 domain-containing protein [Spirochaetaceae bacterium]
MPQTKLEKLFFMSLTVLLSVAAFTTYNVALALGSLSLRVFPLAIREMPAEFALAFLMEALFAGRLAEKLAFKLVDPASDRPAPVILAITCSTICLMCPAMSLASTALHRGIDAELLHNWLHALAYNFPFAVLTQLFLIGPVVRWTFRRVFRGRRIAA